MTIAQVFNQRSDDVVVRGTPNWHFGVDSVECIYNA